MPRLRRLTPRLERVRDRLDDLLAGHDAKAHRAADPVSFVHRYQGADREVVALLAASLAFGNVKAVRASVGRVLDVLGAHPAASIEEADRAILARELDGFVHRVWRGEHVAAMLAGAAQVRREDGTLGQALERHVREAGDLREALARLVDRMRGEDPDRGLSHLLAEPRAGSACKRLLLWLRWMVRPADGVDLGLWSLSPSTLIIPVDTHVQRIAHNLGLTRRRDASWRTAEDITATLRLFDPTDPVKYDFAICHFGVSRQCPSRRDRAVCADCVLRDACIRWR